MELVLTIPDELVPQVDAAVREVYGGLLNPAMDESAAMKAVARFWLADLMANFAAKQARAAGDVQVQAATAAREQAVQVASKAARDAVTAIPWEWSPRTGSAEAAWTVTTAAVGAAPPT